MGLIINGRIMALHSGKKSFASVIAGVLLSIFGKSTSKISNEDLKRLEFKTGTQRLGVRFTEKIREVFRFKWLRKI